MQVTQIIPQLHYSHSNYHNRCNTVQICPNPRIDLKKIHQYFARFAMMEFAPAQSWDRVPHGCRTWRNPREPTACAAHAASCSGTWSHRIVTAAVAIGSFTARQGSVRTRRKREVVLRAGPSQKDYDVIVIGAGLGGLACAAALGKAGRKVLVDRKSVV